MRNVAVRFADKLRVTFFNDAVGVSGKLNYKVSRYFAKIYNESSSLTRKISERERYNIHFLLGATMQD